MTQPAQVTPKASTKTSATSSPSSPLILRGYWRSSATWRVRIALHLKGIEFDYRPIHLVRDGGEQHKPEYTRLNPLAQVPTLELSNGALLTQSLAMIDYLEQLVPEPSLFPQEPLERARAIQLAEIVNSGIQPLQNLSLLQRLTRDYQADKIDWGRRVIAEGLIALEATLNAHSQDTKPSGDFLVGNQPTVAELCLIPQLYNARRFGVDLSVIPRLLRAEAACVELPAFRAAHPDAQVDAQ